jgi:hypothetical protein
MQLFEPFSPQVWKGAVKGAVQYPENVQPFSAVFTDLFPKSATPIPPSLPLLITYAPSAHLHL